MNEINCEILLIQDNPEEANLFIQFAKKYNLDNRFLHLHGGEDALNFLTLKRQNPPRLVIIDLSLGGSAYSMDLIRKIRVIREIDKIPIVALADSQKESLIIELHRLSVNAHIIKPINFVKFKRIVSLAGIAWEYFKDFN